MPRLELSELAIYPVKSFAQVPLTKSELQFGGLKDDRRWMVVDKDNRFLTQRQQAKMCLIKPEAVKDGLKLHAPGMDTLVVKVPRTKKKTTVTVWRDRCQVLDCGDDVSVWLSDFLEIESSLMYFPDEEIRIVDQDYAQPGDRTAFSDGFPILLTTQASLDDLNTRLDTPIPMTRFRPNLVIKGSEAFAEDNWKLLKVGDITLRVVKPCSRCVIPSIDFNTGKRDDEPTQTLVSYRKRDNKIYFGQNVIADGEGVLEVGMTVEVLE